ncbi:hypothetical protein [Reichenbachiella sp. MSK19-1]|uniref:hypothetical protein n=1 Tax=Reichenbachiella sp. MSK19-1 TaxID=1897631 RepID=UPI000E6C8500|nr:hypothetical protein [Reichenbachiella sp. MSK19-1]RJE74171.1 hypothetical protein BGP76_13345 [Reichenbachiella sp. MSK19-1]
MKEHSIDYLIDSIYNSKTKEYFHEVIQSYYANSYRSSIVMLYSVVICDLIYKLEELRDVYNDESAKKILIEIEKLQKANPKSSEWENKIVELISERTKLLEVSDVENINQVQKHRHLSAHPVLNQTSLLYKPNKETVKAHIKNMLEGILTKPSIMSTKIFNELTIDLATNKNRFLNDTELARFLNAKYLKNLRQETISDIFKKMWKLVFKLDNEECNENRAVNYKCLNILFEINETEIIKLLKDEETYFNGIIDGECLKLAIRFCFYHPSIYKALSVINQDQINYEIKSSINLLFISWFAYDSFQNFIDHLIPSIEKGERFYVEQEYFELLKSLLNDYDMRNELLDICIITFIKSGSFDSADRNYYNRIDPYLKEFSSDQLIKLIEGINGNSQINSRNQVKYTNKKIKEVCDKMLPKDFNFSEYYHF